MTCCYQPLPEQGEFLDTTVLKCMILITYNVMLHTFEFELHHQSHMRG